MKVSYYSSLKEQQNEIIEFNEILGRIKEGEWRGSIFSLRAKVKQNEKEEATNIKSLLPAFTYSVTYKSRRKIENLEEYNSIIGLDYDKVEDVRMLKSKLEKQPYTYSAFISPSGNGVKAFIKTNAEFHNHKNVFKIVRDYYDNLMGIESDKSVSDPGRLCFVSFDPDLYMNEDSTPFIINSDSDISLENVWEYTANITPFKDGSRNNFVFNFGCNANRQGFEEHDTLNFALNYTEGDFSWEEIERTVRNVYKNYSHENSTTAITAISAITAKDSEVSPYIPDEIFNKLPDTLKEACGHFTGRERDIFLVTAIAVLSGGMHNVHGLYSNEKVFPNLYSFICAPPASGKGSMKYSGQLGDCYHNYLVQKSLEEMDEYKKKKKTYDLLLRRAKGSEIEDLEEPKEPRFGIFFIPADSSAAMIVKHLEDNDGCGCILETEADTLTNTLKQDWGGYSDMLRKGFQGETISKSRKTNMEYVMVKEPKFSLAMTGTPNQLDKLMPSVQDGLFSRCLFYSFVSEPIWKQTYTDNIRKSKSDYFNDFSAALCDKFKNNVPQRFMMTPEQGKSLDDRFREVLAHHNALYSDSVRGVVFRHGLMVFKSAMVLTALRSNDPIIQCSDEDFETSMTLIETCLQHSIDILQKVESNTGRYNSLEKRLLDWIDGNTKFRRSEIAKFAETINIPDRTLSEILKKFLGDNKVRKIKNGRYEKG